MNINNNGVNTRVTHATVAAFDGQVTKTENFGKIGKLCIRGTNFNMTVDISDDPVHEFVYKWDFDKKLEWVELKYFAGGRDHVMLIEGSHKELRGLQQWYNEFITATKQPEYDFDVFGEAGKYLERYNDVSQALKKSLDTHELSSHNADVKYFDIDLVTPGYTGTFYVKQLDGMYLMIKAYITPYKKPDVKWVGVAHGSDEFVMTDMTAADYVKSEWNK